MTDAAGSTSTTQITVTIQGANDAPTAVADTATAVEAGGVSNGTAGTNPTGNVLTNDTDPDSVGSGETKTVTGVLAGTQASATGNVASSVTGTYGSINIAANGAYTYTVDNSNATVQALRTSGQSITDVFTYSMTDAAGSTSTTQITVTIQGANDAPTAVADTATAVEAGGVSNGTAGTNPTGNVLTNDTDPDSVGNGETKTITGVLAAHKPVPQATWPPASLAPMARSISLRMVPTRILSITRTRPCKRCVPVVKRSPMYSLTR